jgi:hypothetical protein
MVVVALARLAIGATTFALLFSVSTLAGYELTVLPLVGLTGLSGLGGRLMSEPRSHNRSVTSRDRR